MFQDPRALGGKTQLHIGLGQLSQITVIRFDVMWQALTKFFNCCQKIPLNLICIQVVSFLLHNSDQKLATMGNLDCKVGALIFLMHPQNQSTMPLYF